MDRSEEIEARRFRRAKRYINSLPPSERILKDSEIEKFKQEGLFDENGLTPKGQLMLHQLELLEWMVKQKGK